jgi:hypothetical protein
MKFKLIIFFLIILVSNSIQSQSNYWTKYNESLSKQALNKNSVKDNKYVIFELDELAFKNSVKTGSTSHVVYFPNLEGELMAFQVQEKSNMAPSLAAKYASIKSYRGCAASDKSLNISFTISTSGLSALMMSHNNQPAVSVTKLSANKYLIYLQKEGENKKDDFNCTSALSNLNKSISAKKSNTKTAKNNAQGLRTLRIAVVAPGEYTELVGGTVETALAAINNTINSANSVFEEDLGIVLQLIAENDQLIFTDKTTDPYDIEANGVSTQSSYLNIKTQEVIDAIIPFADYDLGHLFIARDEGANGAYGIGNAFGIGNVGTPEKGSAWNYWSQPDVASNVGFLKLFLHEAGHQLGATHTFSFQPDYTFSQVEPFVGRTIMSYGPDYFYYHYYSINQIVNHFYLNPFDVSLGTVVSYANQISLTDLTTAFYVPKGTAFYLEAPETGSDPSYKYNWEGLNYGLTQNLWNPELLSGPLFSSTSPSNNRTRYFPSLQTILDGELTNDFNSYIDYNSNANTLGFYETLPTIARTLNFGLTVRDPSFTKGVYLDSTSVVVVKNTQPFKITSSLAAQNFTAGETTTLTWEAGNTNEAPINADLVNIFLSTDGGFTFPITLAKNVANDGIEQLHFPNVSSTNARIKIQPVNKIFFAINQGSFNIISSDMVLFFENLNLEVVNCSGTTQSFSTKFQYQATNGFSETSALSITGLPAGLTATLSQNTVSVSGTEISIDFQSENSLAPGSYTVNILATAPSKTISTSVKVIVVNASDVATVLSSPTISSVNVLLNTELKWEINNNATKYRVQVSKDASFTSPLIDVFVYNTNYKLSNLDSNTTYYWRIAGVNDCLENAFSAPFSFTTLQAFNQEFSIISHIKNIEIPSGPLSFIINIKDDVPLLDLNVLTSFTGTNKGIFTLNLEGPDGTVINLSNALTSDDSTERLNAEADDQADDAELASSFVITNSYIPVEPLSVFNGKSIKGDWILTILNRTNEGIYLDDVTLKIKASDNYYVPLAISETKNVFGIEARPIALKATNQNGDALSGYNVTITRLPEHGNLLNSTNNSLLTLNEVVNSNVLIYQSTESDTFLGVDYFYFSVNDDTNDSRPAIIILNNIGTYKTPKPLPSYTATPVNTPLELTLDIIDFYLSDIATISLSSPSNGTASYVNEKVIYTPNQGYIGLDTFSYTVDDGQTETTSSIEIKVFTSFKTDTKPSFMLEGAMFGHPVSVSIAISADGNIVAASSAADPSINSLVFEGHVVAYMRDSQTGVYEQLGNQIFGDNVLDQFGGAIALSDNGRILAAATTKVNGFSFGNTDYIKIYQFNEISKIWEQIGQTFTYEGGGSVFDLKLDLNADGSILAIRNPRIGFTDFGQGTVEVYQFDQNNNQWNLLGDKFEGKTRFGFLGTAISLNAVGDVIAISEPSTPDSYKIAGNVKIFKFNGISWVQKGKSIFKDASDSFGTSISINNAGNVIVIGADSKSEQGAQRGIAGYVSVYIFDQIKNDWELKGQTLDGRLESAFANLMFGHSVSIDGSGDIISVGAPTFDSDLSNTLEAFALVYQYNKQTNMWSKINLTSNNGQLSSERYSKSGSNVALSKDGTVLWNGFKPNADKRESAVIAYKLIIDNAAEIQDINFAPKPEDQFIRSAKQLISKDVHLFAMDIERAELTYFISKAPSNGSLKTQNGKEIIIGEVIPDFGGGAIFYTSFAGATSDYFEFKVFDGEKYGLGLVWIDPISVNTLGVLDYGIDNIKIYPNPFKDFFIMNSIIPSKLEIYDISGKIILKKQLVSGDNKIEIKNLQSGIYILKLNTDKGSSTFKVVKE